MNLHFVISGSGFPSSAALGTRKQACRQAEVLGSITPAFKRPCTMTCFAAALSGFSTMTRASTGFASGFNVSCIRKGFPSGPTRVFGETYATSFQALSLNSSSSFLT